MTIVKMTRPHKNLIRSLTLLICMFIQSMSLAIEPDFTPKYYADFVAPFLGIGGSFGKFEDGAVTIAYNPTGAPSDLTIDVMEERFFTAFRVIEGIAGVSINYLGSRSAFGR